MARTYFRPYPFSVSKMFDCPSCGKTNRKRTFKSECTVNPFNKGEDGQPLNADQVRAQSKRKANDMAENFMRSPLCLSCENYLSWSERRDLLAARKSSSPNSISS